MLILCMLLFNAYSTFVFVFLFNVDSMFMTLFVFDVFNVYYIGMYVFVTFKSFESLLFLLVSLCLVNMMCN
jgi:hypothetical protein